MIIRGPLCGAALSFYSYYNKVTGRTFAHIRISTVCKVWRLGRGSGACSAWFRLVPVCFIFVFGFYVKIVFALGFIVQSSTRFCKREPGFGLVLAWFRLVLAMFLQFLKQTAWFRLVLACLFVWFYIVEQHVVLQKRAWFHVGSCLVLPGPCTISLVFKANRLVLQGFSLVC